jgi:RNA polymerase sigma factor (sigma-70 family)
MGTMHMTISEFVSVAPTVPWFPTQGDVPRTVSPRQSAARSKAGHDTLPLLQAKDTPLRIVDDPVSRANDTSVKTAPAVDAARSAEQEQMKRLVLLCLSGDARAWRELVSAQHRRIYGICYRFTGSQTDAEDLTQDVFLKLYRSLSNFDPAKGAFSTWLTTLTRNLLVDHFRRTRQDRATDSLDVSFSGEDGDGPTRAEQLADTRRSQHDQVAGAQLRARIQHALKQLSPELREAVILRDLQDMDYKEIAVILRVPEGTVKSRISRGRGELARILGREGLHSAGDSEPGSQKGVRA